MTDAIGTNSIQQPPTTKLNTLELDTAVNTYTQLTHTHTYLYRLTHVVSTHNRILTNDKIKMQVRHLVANAVAISSLAQGVTVDALKLSMVGRISGVFKS